MPHNPVAQAVLVCEKAITEEGTRNLTLVNCFSGRLVPCLPSPPQEFVVYASLVDGEGSIELSLTVERVYDLRTVYSQRMAVQFTDRLREVRFKFRVLSCVFPETGSYQVCLYAGIDPIARYTFSVALKETPP
jgi:hypothetical protein